MRLVLLALALLSLVPTGGAAAIATLSSFEEPHTGSETTWDFTVVNDEAHNVSAVLFLNPVRGSAFDIVLRAENGTTLWNKTRVHGSETLPPLEPGRYSFFLHGAGTFVVTRRYLDTLSARPNVTITDVERKLAQPTESYVMLPTRAWYVHVEGNVSVEWDELTTLDVTATARHLSTPVNQTAQPSKYYLMYVRGAEGTPYQIHLESTPPTVGPPATASPKTPVPAGLVLVAACVAVLARRALRPKH